MHTYTMYFVHNLDMSPVTMHRESINCFTHSLNNVNEINIFVYLLSFSH